MRANTRVLAIAALVLGSGVSSAWAQMDHGSMQGGSARPDARDPHAWSDGLTFGPDRQLKLADEHSFHSILVNRLEAVRTTDRTTGQYDLQAWFGRHNDRGCCSWDRAADPAADAWREVTARRRLLAGAATATPAWLAGIGKNKTAATWAAVFHERSPLRGVGVRESAPGRFQVADALHQLVH